jgi:3-methyladenine DNA glycosylase AlkC
MTKINLNELIKKISQVKDGFKPIREEAEKCISSHSQQESIALAHELYKSDVYQARMMATIIFGKFAAKDKQVFDFLRHTVAKDTDWRTQEMLAMAFDQYCKDKGYEQSLPVIKAWLKDTNHNVRRAVTEGLRIWTYKDYFKQHPEVAIQLLSGCKDDEHEYVRKSAGNALRDISRFHKDLVKKELDTWDLSNKYIKYTYSLASKFVNK